MFIVLSVGFLWVCRDLKFDAVDAAYMFVIAMIVDLVALVGVASLIKAVLLG